MQSRLLMYASRNSSKNGSSYLRERLEDKNVIDGRLKIRRSPEYYIQIGYEEPEAKSTTLLSTMPHKVDF
jgi:hypothetical protein